MNFTDEEIHRIKYESENIADAVLQAYDRRFPRFDQNDRTVILNSFLITLVAYLKSISEIERRLSVQLIRDVINSMDGSLPY